VIVDCFTFFNELDVLELRLSLLDTVVDRFVLCEAPVTFRGDPKPLYYAQNRDRFARWKDRIVHLVYDAAPDANPWQNEWRQRAHLTSALAQAEPDDLILIGDVDEIPAPELVAVRPGTGRVLAHRHLLAVGYLNRITRNRWIGTKAIECRDLVGRTLNDIRTLPLGAFDHVETDIPYMRDARRLAIQFDSEADTSWVSLKDVFPALLDAARWARYVWPAPKFVPDEAEQLMHAHGCYASVPSDAAMVGALVRAARSLWQLAGEERFGGRFAGAYESLPELLAVLPPDGWAVIGEFGAWPASDVRALPVHGINAVAYASNARSFAVLKAVIEGGRFPAGPALGLPELEASIDSAPFRIEKRYDVMGSVFSPEVFEQSEPFDTIAGPFRFDSTTREAMHHFSVNAYVFQLRAAKVAIGDTTT
jgi:hypothetical protein